MSRRLSSARSPLENKPPGGGEKKDKKEKKPAAAAAPAAKPKPKVKTAAEREEEEAAQPAAPKPKHPLEELGKPTFVLDDWYVFESCMLFESLHTLTIL